MHEQENGHEQRNAFKHMGLLLSLYMSLFMNLKTAHRARIGLALQILSVTYHDQKRTRIESSSTGDNGALSI